MKTKFLLGLLSLAGTPVALAQDLYYYSESVRDILVSGNDDTLLFFPSPPLTSACQPRGVVDLTLVDEVADAAGGRLSNNALMEAARDAREKPAKENVAQGSQSLLSRALRLYPSRGSQDSTTCAFRLANGDSFSVRFGLSASLHKPQIEFRSLYQNAARGAEVSRSLGGLNLFRALVTGADLTFLANTTPTESDDETKGKRKFTVKTTSKARYTLVYRATDKAQFTVWRYEGKASAAIPVAPLKPQAMGDVLFSTIFRPGNPEVIKDGESFSLYLLTRSDLEPREVEAILP